MTAVDAMYDRVDELRAKLERREASLEAARDRDAHEWIIDSRKRLADATREALERAKQELTAAR